MRFLRILRRAAYTILALVLALWVFVQFQQRLLRHRAERLHDEIVAMQLHPGSFADIQRMQKEWGRFAHYDGECTEHHCIYQINLTDFSGFPNFAGAPWYFRPWMYRPYRVLGGRPAAFFAAISVRNDRMWSVGDSLGMAAFRTWNPVNSYLLGVDSTFGTRLFDPHGVYSPSALQRGYTVGRPDGCMGCIVGWINFAPGVSRSEVERLTNFNFSCVTRRKQCLSRDDLIPSAWSDASNSDKYLSTADDSLDCSASLQAFAREAVSITLAEAKEVTWSTESDGSRMQSVRLKIVRQLKNAEMMPIGGEINVWIGPSALISAPSSNTPITRGNRYFLLNRTTRMEQAKPCTIAPFSNVALAAVLQGIDDDASTGEIYSWKDEPRRP